MHVCTTFQEITEETQQRAEGAEAGSEGTGGRGPRAPFSPLPALPGDSHCLPFTDGTGHNSNRDKNLSFLCGVIGADGGKVRAAQRPC